MNRLRPLLCLSVALMGCAAQPKPRPESALASLQPVTYPPKIEAARKATTDISTSRSYVSPDERLRFRSLLQLHGPINRYKDGNDYGFVLEFAPSKRAACNIVAYEVDLASTLVKVSNARFRHIVETGGELSGKQIESVQANHHEGAPLLEASWVYTHGAEGNRTMGQVKVFVGERNALSLICDQTAQFGYDEAFAAGAREILGSMSIEDHPFDAPDYVELGTINSAGAPVGIRGLTQHVFDNGAQFITVFDSVLVATDHATLYPFDRVTTELADEAGYLLESTYNDTQGVGAYTDLTLSRLLAGDWMATGTLKKKPFSAQLPVAKLGSVVSQRRTLIDALSGKSFATTATQSAWHASAPGRVIDATFRIVDEAGNGTFNVEWQYGKGHRLMSVVDASASPLQSSRDSYHGTLVYERVYQAGQWQ